MREAESVSFQGKTKAGQAAEGLERWGCSAEDHCLGLSRLLEPGGALTLTNEETEARVTCHHSAS